MEYGFFTPSTLTLYSEYYNESPSKLLKRSAILFEKLVVLPVGIGGGFLTKNPSYTKDEFLNATSNEDIKSKNDLKSVLLSIEEFEETAELLRMPYPGGDFENTMWGGDSSAGYIDFVSEYVTRKYNKLSIDKLDRYEYKELQSLIGEISMDFYFLNQVCGMHPEFSGLYTELHEQAFRRTYGHDTRKLDISKVIKTVEKINFIDFGDLSWEEILILRKSEFVKDFRKKYRSGSKIILNMTIF